MESIRYFRAEFQIFREFALANCAHKGSLDDKGSLTIPEKVDLRVLVRQDSFHSPL